MKGLGGRCRGSQAGRVAICVEAWTVLPGVDQTFKDMLTEGAWDPPTKPVCGVPEIAPVSQTKEDMYLSWQRRSPQGLRHENISKTIACEEENDPIESLSSELGFCCLARGRRGSQGAIFNQLLQTVKVMGSPDT